MASPNEVNFNLRETDPLSRNNCIARSYTLDTRDSERVRKISVVSTGYQDWLVTITSPKVSTGYLNYPVGVRDTAKSRIGCRGNHRLRCLAEFIYVNVGGSYRDVKVGSLPKTDMSVGGVIVVRGRENRPHGEGRQLFGIPMQNNQM